MSDTQPAPPGKLARAVRWASRLQAAAEACRAEAERCAYWALIFAGAAGVLGIKAQAKRAQVAELVAEAAIHAVDDDQDLADLSGNGSLGQSDHARAGGQLVDDVQDLDVRAGHGARGEPGDGPEMPAVGVAVGSLHETPGSHVDERPSEAST